LIIFETLTENFSFSVSDIEYIISNTDKIVKGISKVMAIFYSAKANAVKAIEIEKPFMPRNFSDIPFDEAKTMEEIETLRNDQPMEYFWYTSQDVPLEQKTTNIKQLDVFDENDRHILLVTVKNENDKKNDLIYYYFNKNLGNFMPSDTETPMDQNNKTIIGIMMYRVVNMMAEKCRNDRKVLISMNKDVRKIVSSLRNKEEMNEKHLNLITNHVADILAELSLKSERYSYMLSEKAINKLKNYKGDLKSLNKIVRHAVRFATNLNVDITDEPIRIQDFHLDFDMMDSEGGLPQPSVKMEESKYNKPIAWLDRLEAAAQILTKSKLPVTGPNLGKNCQPSITAAAISEFMHKNYSKIKTVLETNPDNWPIVRYEFKPLTVFLIPTKKETNREGTKEQQA